MTEMGTREAITLFQFSERVKSFLIVASKMLDGLLGLEGEELEGARSMFERFLGAVMAEVRLAQNATRRQEFGDVNAMLSEVSNLAKSGLIDEAVRKVAEAISLATTCGSQALAKLREEGLV